MYVGGFGTREKKGDGENRKPRDSWGKQASLPHQIPSFLRATTTITQISFYRSVVSRYALNNGWLNATCETSMGHTSDIVVSPKKGGKRKSCMMFV